MIILSILVAVVAGTDDKSYSPTVTFILFAVTSSIQCAAVNTHC